MENCVTCGGTEPTVPVSTCDCQCINTVNQAGNREIRLIAPTRDTDTAWTENDPIVPEGVLCLVKDRLFNGSLEYFIGDGESKYSELTMLYAGAPLSRTGAENHSPLAASGKSTLDPSWLPDATSSAKGAVMTSTTGAAGKVPIAASGASALDPSWLPAATSSALGGVMTSLTGASGKVPIAGDSGKLDPSWFPEATSSALGAVKASTTKAANNVVKADANGGLDGWKDAIIDAIIADDGSGGLSQGADGNLEVDFDAMYTHNRAKFEALLKSLKMQIPLEQDMDFYVDTDNVNASDTIVDGRGSRALPFKTIQACVNFVTQNYALGPYNVTIHVVEGTYSENLSLPQYTRTSGVILISADDYANPPTITNARSVAFVITANGGSWYLERLNIVGNFSSNGANKTYYPGCVQSHNEGTSVVIRACNISAEYLGDAHGYTDSENVFHSKTMEIRTLYVDAGSMSISPAIAGYQTTLSCIKGNASTASMIRGLRGGVFGFAKSEYTDDGIRFEVPCSGTMDAFCLLGSRSRFETGGSGVAQQFSGTITGKAYSISAGASISLPTGGLPGDIATSTLDSSTYCWVA